MKRVLSLGAGVQSTTLLMMSIHDELPKLNAAFFADTGWEPDEVYEHLEWLKERALDASIELFVVSAGNIRNDTLEAIGSKHGTTTLPFHVLKENNDSGKTLRKCTHRYKILPLEKAIRKYCGLQPRQRVVDHVCEQWFGISLDEWKRMRTSPNKWSKWVHPLIDRRITRTGCYEWLTQHGYSAPWSSCRGCPFHKNDRWKQIMANPKYRKDVVEFDRSIRKVPQIDGECYLHRSCTPLDEVNLDRFDPNQLALWGDDECMGMCGT